MGARSGGAGAGAGAATVRVLGSTIIDGESLTGRQRPLVAALVYHRRRGASTEVLIDAVWPAGMPRSARASLQNQIGRLRRTFGDDLIVHDGSGYHLGGVADVEDFERRARRWLARPAGHAVIEPLHRVAGLWRGVPYADLVDLPDVDAERARLTELHAQVLDHLAVSRIAVGDLRGAAADLAALTEADPFREQRWGLLMVALHLNGRRTEALAAFDRAERRLAGELGTTPSPELHRLESRIRSASSADPTLRSRPALLSELAGLLDLDGRRGGSRCRHVERRPPPRRPCRVT